MVALLLPLLASCQTPREVVMPNGAIYRDGGHLAGDTLVYMEPDGTVILRNKMAKSWQDTLQAAVAMYAAGRAAKVDIARSGERTEASLANTAARTEQAKLDAATEALRIQARTKALKLRILAPVVP